MELRVGQILVETYRLERLIGEGGMGSVYEASHLRVPKRFAVKFLNMSLVDKPEALARFRREADILAALDHPNIVGVFDYNVTNDGVPYFVLEFLDGEHLAKRLERGRMSIVEALRVLIPVGRALEAAHAQGVVHRDLKPENILLCRGEVVKVVDFGIAKMRGQDLTGQSSIIGTVPYMAPEQIGGGTVDGRADQFALGAILYEMLTGNMAFGGPETVPEIAMKVLHGQPEPIPGLAPAVEAALGRALAKDAAGRFPSVGALLDALVAGASRREASLVGVIDARALAAARERALVPPPPSLPVPDEAGLDEALPPLAGDATQISRAPAPLVTPATAAPLAPATDASLVTPAMAGPPIEAGASASPDASASSTASAGEGSANAAARGASTGSDDDDETELDRVPVAPRAPVVTNRAAGAPTLGAAAMSSAQREAASGEGPTGGDRTDRVSRLPSSDLEAPARTATLPPIGLFAGPRPSANAAADGEARAATTTERGAGDGVAATRGGATAATAGDGHARADEGDAPPLTTSPLRLLQQVATVETPRDKVRPAAASALRETAELQRDGQRAPSGMRETAELQRDRAPSGMRETAELQRELPSSLRATGPMQQPAVTQKTPVLRTSPSMATQLDPTAQVDSPTVGGATRAVLLVLALVVVAAASAGVVFALRHLGH